MRLLKTLGETAVLAALWGTLWAWMVVGSASDEGTRHAGFHVANAAHSQQGAPSARPVHYVLVSEARLDGR